MIFGVSVPTIFFFCSVLIPGLRVTPELIKVIADMIFYDRSRYPDYHEEGICLLDFPFIRFKDLQARRTVRPGVDHMCLVCSVDYEREDIVSQLGRCGHVFHTECIQKQLQYQNNSTCPFCRTSVFSVAPASSMRNRWSVHSDGCVGV